MIGSADRAAKAASLRAEGVDPYPHARPLARLSVSEFLASPRDAELWGRLISRRVHATATFMDLRDESGEVQLVLKPEGLRERLEPMLALDIGDIVSVEGKPYLTPRGQQSLMVDNFALLAKCLRPIPDKRAGLRDVNELLRRRELDLLSNPKTRDLFATRAQIVKAIRGWLDCRGFTSVETPVLQPLAGGSSSRPFKSRYEALGRDVELSKSPELTLNRCVVGGLERVYALGKSFRNEGLSRKHQPEFTELEWMEPGNYMDVALATESMIAHAAYMALGTTELECQGQTIDLAGGWRRVSFHELAPDMETYSKEVEHTLIQPTFVFDFPLESFPITKRHPDNPKLGEHFDAVIGGIEIVSGDTELNDPAEQQERFIEQRRQQEAGEAPAPFDGEYVRALEYGFSPTGGGGMGIDRLVMILTERENLREVLPFPVLREAQSKAEVVPIRRERVVPLRRAA